jgi:two-component system cell cycle sensor histidine kinase/response regulator CckA
VKQNGGFVWVNSEPGLGTTFKFFLSQVQSLSSEIAITKPVESSPRGLRDSAAGDEASVRQASRQFLIRSGHTVLEATHGEDAIRASHEPRGPIHLLVTDVVMPRMGGPTLAERLTDERPDLKVLFVSGYTENTVLKHGTIDVATRFLQKLR